MTETMTQAQTSQQLLRLIVGGRERTREQCEQLFDQAGLKLNRIVPAAREVSIIEGVRAG